MILVGQSQDNIIMSFFLTRLNTGSRTGSFGTVFSQANPNTVYGSIFQDNMDDDSFNYSKSLIKLITLPRQAFFHFQHTVSDNAETVCKVRYYFKFYHYVTSIFITIDLYTHVA